MLEKALSGSRRYWGWIAVLLAVITIGLLSYLRQAEEGLVITGLGRDVPWGLYISQFTFLVGVAASAVILVLSYYLHDYKAFGRIVVLGEFLAIAAICMCLLFILADMGQPARMLNVILHPNPSSVMFWDMLVLTGYLLLNIVISRVTLGAEIRGAPPPRWIRPVILLSIPWAVSIHTVTAFLYSGLGARPFWLTAILAPRFLASAFASGPAILILLCLLLKRIGKFDVGREAVQKLGTIVVYAMLINIFFMAVELFTVLYGDIPEHLRHLQYLYLGLDGKGILVPWIWGSQILGLGAVLLLLRSRARAREGVLLVGCLGVILAIWFEKGLGMVLGGFIPSTQGVVTEYGPTTPETLIGLGVYGVGGLILTVLFKIVVAERELADQERSRCIR